MLTRSRLFDEEELVEAARAYLAIYTNGRVPFRDIDEWKVRYVLFEWLAEQWVFVEVSD